MERVQFACPACGKSVVMDRKYVGLSVGCPSCLKGVTVPIDAAAFVPPEEAGPPKSPDGLPYKPCPYCTEYVSPHALKCDHCGHRLDVEGPASSWQMKRGGQRTTRYALFCILFALLPVLSMLAVFFGHKALRRIRRSPMLFKGEALAEWGLGIAYLFSVGYLFALIIWLVSK